MNVLNNVQQTFGKFVCIFTNSRFFFLFLLPESKGLMVFVKRCVLTLRSFSTGPQPGPTGGGRWEGSWQVGTSGVKQLVPESYMVVSANRWR